MGKRRALRYQSMVGANGSARKISAEKSRFLPGIGAYAPAHDRLDERFVSMACALLKPFTRYFRATAEGLENIPRGGALFVSNHAVMGIDTVVLYALFHERTGRVLRGMAEHFFFRWPVVGEFIARVGAVDGNRANAVQLIKSGFPVLCYPGGARESFAARGARYRLQWEGRMGYLRVALKAGCPIVPIAAIGPDEAYIVWGREPFFGRRIFGSAKYDLPLFSGLGLLPFPVKFRYCFGNPIDPRKRFGLRARDAKGPDAKIIPAHLAIWRQVQRFIGESMT